MDQMLTSQRGKSWVLQADGQSSSLNVSLDADAGRGRLRLQIDDQPFSIHVQEAWRHVPLRFGHEAARTHVAGNLASGLAAHIVVNCGLTPPLFHVRFTEGGRCVHDWRFAITHEVQHEIVELIESVTFAGEIQPTSRSGFGSTR